MIFKQPPYVDEEEQFSLTTSNQKWFKFLAFVAFFCALFVNAALIWLMVCRANRLPQTDEQLKQDAAFRNYIKKKKRTCTKKKRLNMKKKLKYLFFGNLKVKSPSSSFYASDSGSDNEVGQLPSVYSKNDKSNDKSKKEKKNLLGFKSKSKKNKRASDSLI